MVGGRSFIARKVVALVSELDVVYSHCLNLEVDEMIFLRFMASRCHWLLVHIVVACNEVLVPFDIKLFGHIRAQGLPFHGVLPVLNPAHG